MFIYAKTVQKNSGFSVTGLTSGKLEEPVCSALQEQPSVKDVFAKHYTTTAQGSWAKPDKFGHFAVLSLLKMIHSSNLDLFELAHDWKSQLLTKTFHCLIHSLTKQVTHFVKHPLGIPEAEVGWSIWNTTN